MNDMSREQRKKYIIVASIAVVLLLVVTFVSMLLGGNNQEVAPEPELDLESTSEPEQPASSAMTINGFAERAENLPRSRVRLIEEDLFSTVANSSLSQEDTSATDAMIREGSYKQTIQDTDKHIYFTTFIVDIPSIKQSYRVNDYYSPFPAEVSGLYDYTTLVLCLEQSELIYGYFNCKDRIRMENS